MSKFGFKMHKTFKSLLCVILVIVFIISVSFFIFNSLSSKSALRNQIHLSEQNDLEYFKNLTQTAFSQISLTSAAFSSFDISNLGTDGENLYSNYQTYYKQISLYTAMYDYIEGVYLSNSTYSINKGNFADDLSNCQKTGTYKNTEIYFKQNETGRRSLVFNQNSQNQLDNDVSITINGRNFGKYLIDNKNQKAVKLITDKSGNIIVSVRNDYIEKNVFDLFGFEKQNLKNFCEDVKTEKNDYIFSCNEFEGTELYFIGITDYSVYDNFDKSLTAKNISIAIVLIFLAILITLFLTYIAYRPLRKVMKTASDYYPLSISAGTDEIQIIQEILKSTHQKNKDIQSEIDKNLKELRHQQVLALQSQISPHFIYNVLDSINWLSINLNGCDNIVSDCVQGTQTLFAYSMNYNTLFASIEEELDITKSMSVILSSQFNLEINIIEDIPDRLKKCKILKLSLEPFFENAIIHGYGNYSSSGDIKISVRPSGSDLIIKISDNGIGMSETELKELINSINRTASEDGKHIGMRNVNLRLKILFGEEYTINIESEKNKGTTFTLKMPIVEIK